MGGGPPKRNQIHSKATERTMPAKVGGAWAVCEEYRIGGKERNENSPVPKWKEKPRRKEK